MQFKVGDRVEAIKPPNGVEEREADQIGLGRITAINADGHFGESHAVQLDSGDEWYYSEDRLRPIVSKPTPTPSITVGTQVRLTGVVVKGVLNGVVTIAFPDGNQALLDCSERIAPDYIEVIRQPFKRGEVVYRDDTKYVTVEDEEGGSVKLTTAFIGAEVFLAVASDFERRP